MVDRRERVRRAEEEARQHTAPSAPGSPSGPPAPSPSRTSPSAPVPPANPPERKDSWTPPAPLTRPAPAYNSEELHYVPGGGKWDTPLHPGEAIIFRTENGGLWYLRFCFIRITDGKYEARTIPVSPNSGPQPSPHHTWGLENRGGGRWQVIPSIQCMERVPDPSKPGSKRSEGIDVEVWHHNPVIIGVPDGEPWQ